MLKEYLRLQLVALEWLFCSAVVVLLLISLSPFLPIPNALRTYIVVSGSMEPAIKTGSVAITKSIPASQIKIGDIVAFTSPDNPKDTILHRVVAIKSTKPLRFQTKGDHNNAPDNWDVMDVGVKGIYVGGIPYLGNAAAFIRKPAGFVILVVIPVILFIISQIINIKKAIEEEVQKRIKNELSKKDHKSSAVVLLFLISIAGLFSAQSVMARFADTVKVSGINLTTAAISPAPTITPTPTLTPAPTPTTTPIPSPTVTPTPTGGKKNCDDRINSFDFAAIFDQYKNMMKLDFSQIPGWDVGDSFNYEFTYFSNNVEKGVAGDFTPKDDNDKEKDIFMGTCSGKDCRPDGNLSSTGNIILDGFFCHHHIHIEKQPKMRERN